MPLAQKVEQGVSQAISDGVSSLFTPSHAHGSGQKLPGAAGSSGANPAQPGGAATPTRFSSAVMSTLLALQENGAGGHS
jgi:hypothetical protein